MTLDIGHNTDSLPYDYMLYPQQTLPAIYRTLQVAVITSHHKILNLGFIDTDQFAYRAAMLA